ncbi:MerR family transcriptional regulator [Spiroplasma gladiatoris]|uniref:MerR family transcriptional regulator n=2 Tax=Spiroplasma TaxID=2132 RepID=A0A4V1AQ59_9MOLU|nr:MULTISPECIES: MerR family transcriptional regulator [Spiroplasma]QBQ07359.1 MerR family transcriptional regulator [Spiroplasma gladiatoris]QGS52198.1 MerR family transcriptional regulator [Spiroplasma tabanidicola]
MNKKYYINNISKRYSISEHTLRYYDKKNILSCFKRDANGYRYVEEKDLRFIELVICLKKTKLSLKNIQRYLQLIEQGDTTMLERFKIIDKQLKLAIKMRKDIDDQIEFLKNKIKIFQKILI